MQLNIVADENMPWVEALFGSFGPVTTRPGRAINRGDLIDADVLLVRSVTAVNRSLLEGTPVRFVGSATIGTDHVDTDYLAQQGIAFSNAPGCNADAVVNYVVACLCALEPDWPGKTLGIVGCGNVGGRLYRCLRALEVDCRCYDPFLPPGSLQDLVAFDSVLEADVICLHTPLTVSGAHPTHHLFDRDILARLQPGTLLLNAGRGPVIDNRALLQLLQQGTHLRTVLDVWEPEPAIDMALLDRVVLGTPHIAGYSLEGKVNGSTMVCEAFCRWLGVPPVKAPDLPGSGLIQLKPGEGLAKAVLAAYPVVEDFRRMQRVLARARAEHPAGNHEVQAAAIGRAFDTLRRDYPQRREFSSFAVKGAEGAPLSDPLRRQLSVLGFHTTQST